jgi:hypothetical protein
MDAWAIGLAGALGAGLVAALVRRSRRRRRALLDSLLEALRSAAADLDAPPAVAVAEDRLRVTFAEGRREEMPWRRLLAATDRGHPPAAVAEAALLLLENPLRPMPGPLALKVHGLRVRACLVPAAAAPLLAGEPSLAVRPIAGLPLVATYRVDGRADACLTEDHLQEQAVDTHDVHGIALAVLRQGFDEAIVRRLTAESASQVVQTPDDGATAIVLVLQDFLPTDLVVEATLVRPDRLELRRSSAAPERDGEARGPLRLRIDADGWRIL